APSFSSTITIRNRSITNSKPSTRTNSHGPTSNAVPKYGASRSVVSERPLDLRCLRGWWSVHRPPTPKGFRDDGRDTLPLVDVLLCRRLRLSSKQRSADDGGLRISGYRPCRTRHAGPRSPRCNRLAEPADAWRVVSICAGAHRETAVQRHAAAADPRFAHHRIGCVANGIFAAWKQHSRSKPLLSRRGRLARMRGHAGTLESRTDALAGAPVAASGTVRRHWPAVRRGGYSTRNRLCAGAGRSGGRPEACQHHRVWNSRTRNSRPRWLADIYGHWRQLSPVGHVHAGAGRRHRAIARRLVFRRGGVGSSHPGRHGRDLPGPGSQHRTYRCGSVRGLLTGPLWHRRLAPLSGPQAPHHRTERAHGSRRARQSRRSRAPGDRSHHARPIRGTDRRRRLPGDLRLAHRSWLGEAL